MEKAPLSIIIIAKNEEKRLGPCIESVAWAQEVVVIDDDSSDRTAELATDLGAKVYRRRMDIEGRQRNFGFEKATQPWLLSLDADERVTPALAKEIQEKILQYENQKEVAGFAIPIKTFIGSRWVRGAGYYPARKTRLFRKGRFQYEEAKVHPRALYEGKIIELDGDILHYSCSHLGEFVTKFNRETALEAEKWITDGRKVNLPNSLRKTIDRFLKNYFLKDGYKDGFMGFMMSVFHGFYQLITYAKYREMKSSKVVFIDRDGVVNEDLFDYVKTWGEFRFQKGVVEGMRRLSQAGYKLILISNQAGVGDGKLPEKTHWEIHEKMKETLESEGVKLYAAYYCLHGKQAGCECRKPKTGLFQKVAQNGLNFDKAKTFFIGDKTSDIEAGKNFGLRTILVRTGYGKQHEAECQVKLKPDAVVDNFEQAVAQVLCA